MYERPRHAWLSDSLPRQGGEMDAGESTRLPRPLIAVLTLILNDLSMGLSRRKTYGCTESCVTRNGSSFSSSISYLHPQWICTALERGLPPRALSGIFTCSCQAFESMQRALTSGNEKSYFERSCITAAELQSVEFVCRVQDLRIVPSSLNIDHSSLEKIQASSGEYG